MVKCVKSISEFTGIRSEHVRVEFGRDLFYHRWEPCNLLGESNFLFGFQFIAVGKCASFLENAAGTGMRILDVGTTLALEIQCLLPVKNRTFLRRNLYDIIADGCQPDRFCD